MKYNFKEKQLGHNFAKGYSDYVHKLILASISFTLIGIRGVCLSTFLRFIMMQGHAHFVYLDIRALYSHTKEDFFKLLLEKLGYSKKVDSNKDVLTLCGNQLSTLLQTHKKIVIIINRFHQLKDCMDSSFFSNLRFLHGIDRERIVFITTAKKPLYELSLEMTSDGNMELFSKVVYFKPYSLEDMKQQLSISVLDLRSKEELPVVLEYAGGHVNLMQLLLRTDYINDPLRDPYIVLELKMIYDNFTPSQQRQLQKIVKGKDLVVDEFLYQVGMVKDVKDKKVLFLPLMQQYIASQLPQKFSGKEGTLFYLLKKNRNKVVSKDAIFSDIWKDKSEEASDWALNALMYRLRKNPLYINSGYYIENHKGLGYKLIKR